MDALRCWTSRSEKKACRSRGKGSTVLMAAPLPIWRGNAIRTFGSVRLPAPGSTPRPESVAARLEPSLPEGFKCVLYPCLQSAVTDRRDAEGTQLSARLRDGGAETEISLGELIDRVNLTDSKEAEDGVECRATNAFPCRSEPKVGSRRD